MAQGEGEATAATVSLADLLFVRDVRSPLTMSKEVVKLAPLRGRVAGGQDDRRRDGPPPGRLPLRGESRGEGADVKALLSEAKSTSGVTGTLAARATFEGSGGLPTLKGRGQGTVGGCRVERARTLALLAGSSRCPSSRTRTSRSAGSSSPSPAPASRRRCFP